jgi:hypothetical protein
VISKFQVQEKKWNPEPLDETFVGQETAAATPSQLSREWPVHPRGPQQQLQLRFANSSNSPLPSPFATSLSSIAPPRPIAVS